MNKNNNSNDGWMKISEEGFGEQNAGRPKGHLVKELVQNGWDALSIDGGEVRLLFTRQGNDIVKVRCIDNGPGIDDLDNLRTMFFTGKKDSSIQRGRFGRGFKEMLCLAITASVVSRKGGIFFNRTGNKRGTVNKPHTKYEGTNVEMFMPWSASEIEGLTAYFRSFLPPDNIDFYVGQEPVIYREPAHSIQCTINTEVFENSIWFKRRRATIVHLVPTNDGEEPTLYEMGIPVCPAEWTAPYHIDVQQRVPMNPNRDAVMSGYVGRLHGELIERIYTELPPEVLKEEWVGSAAKYLSTEHKELLVKRAFGTNIARSVPAMSSQQRQFDVEAQQEGTQVVNTRHLAGGFREIFQEVVPTTRQVVERVEQERRHTAAASGTSLASFATSSPREDVRDRRQELVASRGGQEQIDRVLLFYEQFANVVADDYLQTNETFINEVLVAELENDVVLAGPNRTLTIALNSNLFWADPIGDDAVKYVITAVVGEICRRGNHDARQVLLAVASKAISVLLREAGGLEAQLDALAR